MANGWSGTHEDWERLQAPLLDIDPLLYEFAWSHGADLEKNRRGYPDRFLVWGNNPRCIIQIYPEAEEGPTWNLWLCCYRDQGGQRYWRNKFAVRDKKLDEFADQLAALLEVSFDRLNEWMENPDRLRLAAKGSRLPPI